MKTIAQTVGVARSNLVVQAAANTSRHRRGRRPVPEDELLAEIKDTIAGQPTYGYRRIHALLRRQRREQGAVPVNVKRVYRVMKAHGLLLGKRQLVAAQAARVANLGCQFHGSSSLSRLIG